MDYPMQFPKEDYSDYILKDYEFRSDEYPTAYLFRQILESFGKSPYLDWSQISDDFYFNERGIITSRWTIFFTCLPQEADRLRYILRRLDSWAFIMEVDYDDFYPIEDRWFLERRKYA